GTRSPSVRATSGRTPPRTRRRARSSSRTRERTSMKRTLWLAPAGLLAAVGGGALLAHSTDVPQHAVPPSATGNVVVGLCDGVTTAEIPRVKQGERPTRAQAQAVSDALMREWRAKNPTRRGTPTAGSHRRCR